MMSALKCALMFAVHRAHTDNCATLTDHRSMVKLLQLVVVAVSTKGGAKNTVVLKK